MGRGSFLRLPRLLRPQGERCNDAEGLFNLNPQAKRYTRLDNRLFDSGASEITQGKVLQASGW